MIDHSIFDDTEPPPSYEEAVGGSSSNNPFRRRPPPPPPRRTPRPLSQIYTTSNSSSSSNSNNPFNHNNSNPKTNNNVNRSNSTPVRNGNPYSTPPTTPSGSSSSSSTTTTTTTTTAAAAAPSRHPAQTFQQILPAIQPPRQFPPSFNLYRDAFPSRRSFFLGEHQADPLYAVTAWTGWSSRANLVLHNGAAEDAPPLATVSYDPWGRRMDVSLPPPAPTTAIASAPISIQVPTAARQRFVFRVDIPWPHNAVFTGQGQQQQRRKESFEWRRSNGLAVAGLGGRSQGWKLVRLSGEVPPHDPAALAAAVLGSGPRSGGDDGCEVVAVCAQAVMSMTKLWKFAFLGTGVSGALGERWAVMAVVTGLAIWDQESRGN